MDFGVRGDAQRRPSAPADHPCPQCRQRTLLLKRRHVSPAHLGDPMVTEYYECDFCEANFQYSPAAGRWKPVSQ